MSVPDILAAVTPVADAMVELGVAHYIGGSVASSVHGVPRATLDVDLVADLRLEHARGLAELLRASYYVDEDMIRDAIRRRACFNVIHLATMLKVDVFVVKDTPYDRQAFRRMLCDTLEDTPDARQFFVASPEDTILNKLDWYRLGGFVSERQWRDVLGVLKVQGTSLDRAYLSRWASELGLSDLLARALDEAGWP
jgi:hypothetical protein